MLDNPQEVITHIDVALLALMKAHRLATEDNDLTGHVRDMIYGINSVLETLLAMLREQYAPT